MKAPVSLLLVFLASSLAAQDLSQFDKILVPVLNAHAISGANGSTFGTSIGVYSPQKSFSYYPGPTNSDFPVPIVRKTIPAMQILPLWEQPGVTAQGRFIFVQHDAVDLPFASLATASDPTGVGTIAELPIVRERDTRTSQIVLMNMPVRPILSAEDPSSLEHFHLLGWNERNTLRIYDWNGDGSLVVRVSLLVSAGQSVRGGIDVPVNRRDGDDPSYPYYAMIDLTTAFGTSYCWPGLHTACEPYDANLLITGNGATPFYAIGSSTDNRTNHITIFTPR